MFRKIMVATGDSPWSRNAVEYAVQLSASQPQELLIAHVVNEDLLDHLPPANISEDELREQLEASGQDILQRAVQAAEAAQVSARTTMASGNIALEIVRIATEAECDLIVMGTRHLSGDKRLMTGGNCNAVLATSRCPVLVVPFLELGRPGKFA